MTPLSRCVWRLAELGRARLARASQETADCDEPGKVAQSAADAALPDGTGRKVSISSSATVASGGGDV